MPRFLFLLTLLLIISVHISDAQFRMNVQDRLKRLEERLNLSKNQSVKVEAILKKSDGKIKALPENRSERWEKMKGIMDEENKEIEKILNKDQKVEFNKMLDERKARMREIGPGGSK
jgi:periplasmic protein CpxP/Spy